MSLRLRVLVALRSLLDALIKEITMSQTLRTQRIFLAAPPAALAALQAFLYGLGRPVGSVDLVIETGASPSGPVLYRAGSDTYTEAEVIALRPWVSPGGEGHALGIRARRGINATLEIAAPDTAPGKATVNVIEEGEPIPAEVDWADTRLTFPRFLEELGVSPLEPAI